MDTIICGILLLIVLVFWIKFKDNFHVKIIVAMCVSLIVGIYGDMNSYNLSNLGSILSIVVMGGFILLFQKK